MKKRKLINLIALLILIAGISFVLYPTFSDWWNSMHQSKAIATYIERSRDVSLEKKNESIEAAREYNKTLLAKNGNRFVLSEEERARYESILDITGTGIMGVVEIPVINIKLPIYHGTDLAVLQIGIGHMPGTSMPVGGPGTHSVIAGHTGMPSVKLFTDIRDLKNGDVFRIKVFDKIFTYKVDAISTVLPTETDGIAIENDKDYVTLQTCTPYGSNTHRLLVRGRRVKDLAGDVGLHSDVKEYHHIIFSGIILGFIAIIILIIKLLTKATGRLVYPALTKGGSLEEH